MKRTRRKIASLIVEKHPVDYTGPAWLTFVHYVNRTQLVVVDALDKNYLWCYNFDDMNDPERQVFTELMNVYWDTELYGEPIRKRVPVHEWIYDRGLGREFGDKLVGYNINDVLRVVGSVRKADPLGEKMQVKRRKRVLVIK